MKAKRARKILIFVLLAGASLALFYFYFERSLERKEENFIRISGTVDADVLYISSLVPGKVSRILVDEGNSVKEGDIMAYIDDEDYKLKLKKLKAMLAGAEARYRMVKKGAREEDIARMREKLRQAKIALNNAEKNYERAKKLYEAKVFPRKKYDDAYFAYKRALAGYRAVREEYRKLVKGSRPEEIEMALANVNAIKAEIEEVEKKISDCVIEAPVNGIVLCRLVNVGEVVPVGKPLFSLADLSVVKVRGYLSEKDLGFIKLGEEVSIYVDTFPEKPLKGIITYISSVAEFTPKNVQTKDERVKLVYEIKVKVRNDRGILKLGMPVDIVIRK